MSGQKQNSNNHNKKSVSNEIVVIIIIIGALISTAFAAGSVIIVGNLTYHMRRDIITNRLEEREEFYDSYDGEEDMYGSDTKDDVADYEFNAIREADIDKNDLNGYMILSGVKDDCYIVKAASYDKYKDYSNVVYEKDDTLDQTDMTFYGNPEIFMEAYSNDDTFYMNIETVDRTSRKTVWYYYMRHSIPEKVIAFSYEDLVFENESEVMEYINDNKTEAPEGYQDSQISFVALTQDRLGTQWSLLGWIDE